MQISLQKLFFIAIFIGTVFSPAIFAELSTVDDLDMYRKIAGSDFSFKSVFFPQSTGGAYYRPLIGISYLFDKHVWLLDTRLMHLDNIFFHYLNSILVYILVVQLLPKNIHSNNNLPLIAALLFGLHPITSESVNWISGRTDVFACTFVLLSTLSLLKYRETKNILFLLLAPFMLAPGILVKETPLVFVLCTLFILYAQRDGHITYEHQPLNRVFRDILSCSFFAICAIALMITTYNVWFVFIVGFAYLGFEAIADRKCGKELIHAKSLLLIIFGGAGAIWVFFFIRSVVFRSSLGSIPRTIKIITEDLNYSLQIFLGAAGFYVKKFFWPFPLNLAIREIDPLYNFFGVIVFMFCLYLLRKNTILSAFFLSGVCLFLPALPLSLGTVTWTAYAERYIYISSAFWVIVLTVLVAEIRWPCNRQKIINFAGVTIISAMAVLSYQRSVVWKTNLTLWRDTVSKSPAFKMIRVDYMLALINSGDLNEAKKQYIAASAMPSVSYNEMLDLAMASILAKEHDYERAEKLYERTIEKTHAESVTALEMYLQFLRERATAEIRKGDGKSFHDLLVKQLECMKAIYRLNKDPMILYRSGQLSLFLCRQEEALSLFKKAVENLPVTNEYSVFASKLVRKLSETKISRSQYSNFFGFVMLE